MMHSEFYKLSVPIMITIMVLTGGFLLWDILQDIPDTDDVTVETIYIRSLYYQRDLKADFILGCGSMDGVDYYIFYRVFDDGGVQLMRIKASEAVIYETLSTSDQSYMEIERNYWGKTTNKLYVPIGTIQEQYQLP